METTMTTRSVGRVLDAIEQALSWFDPAELSAVSREDLLAYTLRARKCQDRVLAMAGVLTDAARRSEAGLAVVGTPITSVVSLVERRDAKDAAAQVFAAADLCANPSTTQAALAGDVSTRHAVAITHVLAELPTELNAVQRSQAEQFLLHEAASKTPAQMRKSRNEVLELVAPDLVPSKSDQARAAEMTRQRAVAKRCFSYGDDGDGSTWFKGSLPHVEASPLIALIEAYVESDRRAERSEGRAVARLRPGNLAMRDHYDRLGRSPEQRRADALTTIINDHRGAPSVSGDRPRMVVTMTEADLRNRAIAVGAIGRHHQVSPGELRRLCCDADITPVVLGSASEVLDVGRTQRLVTPAIRKALSHRDKGCVFSGCHQSDARCEAHHIIPWTDGGATALSNLALVCPHHHRLLEPDPLNPHRDRWRIHIDETSGAPIVTPTRRFTALTS